MRLEADLESQGPELGTAALVVGNVVVAVGTAALEVGTAALQVGTVAPGLAVAEAQLLLQVVGNSAPAAEVGNFVEAEDFEHFDQN